jgi:thiol-disulfide isomerase/thioredoxin
VTPYLLALCLAAPPAETHPAIGVKIGEPQLLAPNGNPPAPVADAKARVYVFLSNGCPACSAYALRLKELHRRYAKEGVHFTAVYSSLADDAAAVGVHAKELALPFPTVLDPEAKFADKFGIDRVPAAILCDAGRAVRYIGRIDDQFSLGVHRPAATTRELANAIDALLEGRDVKNPHAAVNGCKITKARPAADPKSAVTYHAHVAGIVQAKCQRCHRAGEAGPFAFDGFRSAAGRAAMIREVVADNIMPPWHADAPPGHFTNDRRLSDAEKRTLLAWIDAGCPEGDPADGPKPVERITGWRLPRTPDRIITMSKTVRVPASTLFNSGLDYQYIVGEREFKEDCWVQACEARPDYRAAIHHIICYVLPPGKRLNDLGEDFADNMLVAYVPGDQPIVYPPGHAKKIVKGSRLLFEMHYTPNGVAGTDCSSVGLIFADKPPTTEVLCKAVLNGKFEIPPGNANYTVAARERFAESITAVSFAPHMHLRGKAFRFEALYPDNTREVLLNVPKYDFNWQATYTLAKPKRLPAGTTIECTAVYDNSKANPFNPDPTKRVRWGDQTWEEMMIGFLEFYK